MSLAFPIIPEPAEHSAESWAKSVSGRRPLGGPWRDKWLFSRAAKVLPRLATIGFIAEILDLAWIGLLRPLHPAHPVEAYSAGALMAVVFALLCTNVRWICRAFPLREGAIIRALWVQSQAALLFSLAWSWLTAQLLLHFAGTGSTVSIASLNRTLTPLALGFWTLSVAIAYLLQSWRAAREAERALAEARLQAREAELRALRAQVNPHFLFNSLHSISTLAGVDAVRARQMCLHLSELYRLTLGQGQRERTSLREELAVVRAYLAVEAVRFGERLRYREEVAEEALDLAMPALLLQPLVENAIKHGIAGLTRPGDLLLRARSVEGHLLLELINDFDPDSPTPAASGHGLQNVRQRLAALDREGRGERAGLRLQRGAERFTVQLELPAIRLNP